MSAAHPAYHIILGKLHNDRINDRANERHFVIGGFTADKLPDAMQNYLHNINARISNPLRIRIGGNGMDISTYDPDKTDVMLTLTDPDAYFNDIPCTFGPVFFDVLNAMSDKVGDLSYILGLPMRQPEYYDNAVLLAKAAQEKLGDKLDALLLGNVSINSFCLTNVQIERSLGARPLSKTWSQGSIWNQ